MNGGFLGGLAEGLNAGQQIKARRDNAAMAQQQFELDKQYKTMSMQKMQQDMQNDADARKKQAEIQAGMVNGFQNGGYEGVVHYLENVDPEYAIKIRTAKANMDASIDSASNVKLLGEKAKLENREQAYTILGKMGSQILSQPAEERAQMYGAMLPMLKEIDPNMPDTYDKNTEDRIKLQMGVAMPASQLFGAQKSQARAQTNIGKISADISKLKDMGYTDDSPEIKALKTQLQGEIDNNTEAQITGAKNAPNEDSLRDDFVNINKNYVAVKNQWMQIGDYNSKVATPMGDMKLIYAFNKMMNPNDSVKEGEYANTTNAASWSDKMRNNYNRAVKGNLIADDLRDDMLSQGKSLFESFTKSYEQSKASFTEIAVRRGLDPRNVVIDLAPPEAKSSPPSEDWISQAMKLNPGFTRADALQAWDYVNSKAAPQGQQNTQPQGGLPAQQPGGAPSMPQQQPVGEGNPPWQANGRSMF